MTGLYQEPQNFDCKILVIYKITETQMELVTFLPAYIGVDILYNNTVS